MAPTTIQTVIKPAAAWFATGGIYDLIDLATVKQILNITTGATDKVLQRYITEASSAIRKHCNRTFQIQTYSELLWSDRDPYPWQLPSGLKPLQLWAWPLASPPCLSGNAAPAAVGALSAVSGGQIPTTSYFVRVTYQTATGESPVSPETSLIVAADNLLAVAAPPTDPAGAATGWNVYVGTAAGAETRQNAAPIALTASWTLPATGLLTTTVAPPPYISVTINANVNNQLTGLVPQNLIEGRDFIANARIGQLSRLDPSGYPRHWEMLPIQVLYQAGYLATDPEISDLQAIAIRLVTAKYFAGPRDPNVKAENIEGVYSAQYWFANGPGGARFSPDIASALDEWRVPLIG